MVEIMMEVAVPNQKFEWWKLVTGYLMFIFFHEFYKLTGGSVIGAVFGEAIDAIYPHMKMLFYSYLVVCIIEYLLQLRQGLVPAAFFYARMLILATAPWLMIAVYFIPLALNIPLPGRLELIWALLMTAVGIYICIRLEDAFDTLSLRPAVKAIVLLVFVASLVTYTGFSFHVPDNFFYVNR